MGIVRPPWWAFVFYFGSYLLRGAPFMALAAWGLYGDQNNPLTFGHIGASLRIGIGGSIGAVVLVWVVTICFQVARGYFRAGALWIRRRKRASRRRAAFFGVAPRRRHSHTDA